MSPTPTSPSADLKISPKAKIIDSKLAKSPVSPLARAPSPPPARPNPPTSPITDKKPADKKADIVAEVPDDNASTSAVIDMETFYQILDLDEDDTHDFSRGMAWAYFDQVDTTFDEMDEAFSKKNLDKLSALGHFLKGSSAALGFQKVQASCELIQHLGHKHDSETGKDITSEVALGKIGPLLVRVKVDYSEAEKWLKNWFAENAGGDYPPED